MPEAARPRFGPAHEIECVVVDVAETPIERPKKSRSLTTAAGSSLKIFRIVAERYRNRRKRFSLRLNLMAGLYNYELGLG